MVIKSTIKKSITKLMILIMYYLCMTYLLTGVTFSPNQLYFVLTPFFLLLAFDLFTNTGHKLQYLWVDSKLNRLDIQSHNRRYLFLIEDIQIYFGFVAKLNVKSMTDSHSVRYYFVVDQISADLWHLLLIMSQLSLKTCRY